MTGRSSAAGDQTSDDRLPVFLEEVDSRVAKDTIRDVVPFAADVVGGVDAYTYRMIAERVTDHLVEGRARTGLTLSDVARCARVGYGHLVERLGPDWQKVSDLGVRTVFARSHRHALYEEILSLPVEVRPRHNGLGTDRDGRGPKALHFVLAALAAADRHCPTFARALTTGTRDDRTSDRADCSRITEWSQKLGYLLPGSLADHVELILAQEREVLRAVAEAAAGSPEAFGTVSPARLGCVFPVWLLIAQLPYGPPRSRARSSADFCHAGRDEAIVEAVVAARRYGVLSCGAPQDDELRALEREFHPLQVGRLPNTYELGITRLPKLRYRWSPKRRQLAREVVGRGAQVELWRLVGIDDRRLLEAVSLIERHVQNTLPPDCLERWARDCGPGLLKARHPWKCGGFIDLMNLANAALVDAARRE